MPTSDKPRKKFAGNKLVFSSKEYGLATQRMDRIDQRLREAMGALQQVQNVLMAILNPQITPSGAGPLEPMEVLEVPPPFATVDSMGVAVLGAG